MNRLLRILVPVTLFAIAMGLLETIVVVYLRELYYPEGFSFPLRMMKNSLIEAELLREGATLIMLVAVGWMAGKNGTTRFAWFIYAFAVWDIFYYIFLKLLLNWPATLLDWDILFLIPVTWVGPVLGPVVNSLMMILLAILLVKKNEVKPFRLNAFEWFLLISGSVIVILSYTEEYSRYMLSEFSLNELLHTPGSSRLLQYATSFIPRHFNWGIYLAGVSLHILALLSVSTRKGKTAV